MKDYMSENMKVKKENIKYDFLPSMIEIIEKPANKLCNIILYLIISVIAITIIWAAFFKLDIVVVASGVVMPNNGIVTVQSTYGGKVNEICAAEGAYVKPGDAIVKLECNTSWHTYEKCKYTVDVLTIRRDVYNIVYKNLNDNNGYDLEVNTSQYGELSSIAEQIVIENTVYLKNYESANEEDKENIKNAQLYSVLESINSINANLKAAQIELDEANNELEKYTLRAHGEGKVSFMNPVYMGMLISSGDLVASISEDKTDRIFIAYVSNSDIDEIKNVKNIKIRIAALDDTEYEIIDGDVLTVSDITKTIEGLGNMYEVKIALKEYPAALKTGLEGRVDIIVGKRTVLEYFLEPFKKGLNDSLKEK